MEEQATDTQADRHAPTYHTSRHPNGTFVPLMKEEETVRCGWTGPACEGPPGLAMHPSSGCMGSWDDTQASCG